MDWRVNAPVSVLVNLCYIKGDIAQISYIGPCNVLDRGLRYRSELAVDCLPGAFQALPYLLFYYMNVIAVSESKNKLGLRILGTAYKLKFDILDAFHRGE